MNRYVLSSIFIIAIACNFLQSQVNYPLSYYSKELICAIDINNENQAFISEIVNADSLIEFENKLNEDGKIRPTFFGIEIPLGINFKKSGVVDTVGEFIAKLLQKIEESTLYVIYLKYQNKKQNSEFESLKLLLNNKGIKK